MAHRGNSSEQGNYTTVNQRSETSGGLGPSNNAQTCPDGLGSTSIAEVEYVLLASESGNYPIQYSQTSNRRNTAHPIQYSQTSNRRNTAHPIETRSGNSQQNLTPSTQMPWVYNLKNDYVQTGKDWVCWEHTPVDFRDDDITFVVKTAKRMEQILIHHYGIKVPIGKNNQDLREVIEIAAKQTWCDLKPFEQMQRFRMIRNKLVHKADFNHVEQNERMKINTACMEIFLALEGECNCKELNSYEKQESYQHPTDTSVIILPDDSMYIHNKVSREFKELFAPKRWKLYSHGTVEGVHVRDGPKIREEQMMSIPAQMNSDFENEETEDSCFDMLEDLIRNNPNLRDILDEDQEPVSSEGELERPAEELVSYVDTNSQINTDLPMGWLSCKRTTKLKILKVCTRVFLNEAGQFGAAFFMKEQYFNQAEMYPRFLIGLLKLCAFQRVDGILIRHLAHKIFY